MRGAPLSPEHKAKLAEARREARARRLAAREARKPAVPITETAEFKAAIALVKQQLLDELAAVRQAPAAVGGDQFWAEKLANAIADQAEPGRAKVDPDEVERRLAAKAELRNLLVERYAETGKFSSVGDMAKAIAASPQYELTSKVCFNIGNGEELIEPMQRGQDNVLRPTRICWLDCPNTALRPVNRHAEKIMSAWLRSVGDPDNIGRRDYQGGSIEPPPAGGFVERDYDYTAQGRAVVGLSAAQIGSRAHGQLDEATRVQFSNFGMILGQNDRPTQHNQGGPPFVDVRVLGTISPPARQNG